MGSVEKDIGSLAAIVTGLNLPILLLSGVLLPLSLAPDRMRFIAHFNPLYYAVESARLLSNGIINSNEVLLGFLVIISLTILTMMWATRIYNKAVA